MLKNGVGRYNIFF